MKALKMVLVAALALASVSAKAEDEALVSAMIGLDKVYINPLFFTSNMNPPKSKATFDAFVAYWDGFSAQYRAYRPTQENWGEHFDKVDAAIAAARPVVYGAAQAYAAGSPSCLMAACPVLVTAHDDLEAVRYAMRDLRTHNGFPKFVTDKLTAYHDPMEAVVLTFKGVPLSQITPEQLAAVGEYLDEAMALWSFVVKTPIDAAAWGFSETQMSEIAKRINDESAILEALVALYDAGDFAALSANSFTLKAKFVPVYTAFASDPLLNKLPQ
jgi:hypothetical protein